MKPLAIAATNLRRLSRTPRSLLIIGIGPLLLIFLLGSAFGSGSTTRVDVLAPRAPYAERLLHMIGLQPGVTLARVGDERELRRQIEYGEAEAGIVVPSGYDGELQAGRNVTLRYYSQKDVAGEQVSQIVQSGMAEETNEVIAAALLKRERGMSFAAALARAESFDAKVPKVVVRTVEPNGKKYPKALQRFTGGAYTQLLLFIFLTSLTNSAALVETRRLGVSRRMIASPTTVRTVIFGEALGRLALAGVQALLIVLVSMLLFGVQWGNGLGVAMVTLSFCLVAAGFAMLLGSTLATEQQALAVGVMLGLSLAALGGGMVPLQFFPPILRDIAHVTPHAWGNEALTTLATGGTVSEVLPQIGVLLVFAAIPFSLATRRLRYELTH
jgi:ABC-2 type transport system permease protein